MPTHFHSMPIDRTMIQTRLRIHPELLDDPKSYFHKHELQIRTSKPSRVNSKQGPARNLTLDILTYKGIKAKLCKVFDDPLTDVTINFNPGVCLHGHNGAVLTLTEFLHALAILVTHLKPLLSNPDDWVDLIPGLRSGGVAYWSYLEILLQLADHDGTLLAGFRNAQCKNGQTPIRHWLDSMVIGGNKSKLKYAIYRKPVEMVAHNKLPEEQLTNYRHIIRLEVRLKENKLVHYLGNERNVEEIDGVMRLVKFYPHECVAGHRASFSDLKGVYHSDELLTELIPKEQRTPLGRLLARVALDPRSSHTFQELLAHIRFYTRASSDTMGKTRKAGIAELSRLSTISQNELFSDYAYQAQLSIASEELEKKVRHEFQDTFVHRLIADAYRPPNQLFQPIIEWPKYIRV